MSVRTTENVFVCVYFPVSVAVHFNSTKLESLIRFKLSQELLTTFIQSVPHIKYVVDATNDCSN